MTNFEIALMNCIESGRLSSDAASVVGCAVEWMDVCGEPELNVEKGLARLNWSVAGCEATVHVGDAGFWGVNVVGNGVGGTNIGEWQDADGMVELNTAVTCVTEVLNRALVKEAERRMNGQPRKRGRKK